MLGGRSSSSVAGVRGEPRPSPHQPQRACHPVVLGTNFWVTCHAAGESWRTRQRQGLTRGAALASVDRVNCRGDGPAASLRNGPGRGGVRREAQAERRRTAVGKERAQAVPRAHRRDSTEGSRMNPRCLSWFPGREHWPFSELGTTGGRMSTRLGTSAL